MITVVSGLPRSGTSLMMQMLLEGGMPVLRDAGRPADEHDPRGYLEYRKVRSLKDDCSWLHDADGRAIKVVSQLLYYLPADFEYRDIFMRRDLDEVLQSQEKMPTSNSSCDVVSQVCRCDLKGFQSLPCGSVARVDLQDDFIVPSGQNIPSLTQIDLTKKQVRMLGVWPNLQHLQKVLHGKLQFLLTKVGEAKHVMRAIV